MLVRIILTRVSQPTSSSSNSNQVFCVFCGSENPKADTQCTRCGRELFIGVVESVPQEHSSALNTEPTVPESPPTEQPAPTILHRGINTKQMIVLWYGALACVVVAIISGSSTVGAFLAVIVFTGMAVFTLSQQPNVRKQVVAIWVIGPLALSTLCVASIIYFPRNRDHLSDISPDSIILFDTKMSLGSYCGEVTGRVRNQSDKAVKSIKVRITLSDSTGPIDGADAYASVEVPPGETRSFNTSACGLRESPGWTWNYKVLEVRGE